MIHPGFDSTTQAVIIDTFVPRTASGCATWHHLMVNMRIQVKELAEGKGRFFHRYDPDELTLDDEHARLIEPPIVEGRVYKSDQGYRVEGHLTARAAVDCDRCLNAVEIPVDTEFDVTYIAASNYLAAETPELHADDLDVSVFEGDELDVDDLVREQVFLSLPSRVLCTEQCHGICPECGANMNHDTCSCQISATDPRWDALRSLNRTAPNDDSDKGESFRGR